MTEPKQSRQPSDKRIPTQIETTRFNYIWLLVLLIITLILYPIIFRDVFFGRQEEVPPKQISVIMRDLMLTPGEKLLREGMEQAAMENNLELNYISLVERQSATEQIAYLRREMEQKVDGIILLPTDTSTIADVIDFDQFSVPIVQLGGPAIHDKVPRIGASAARIAEILMEEIQRKRPQHVYLIYQGDKSVPSEFLEIAGRELTAAGQPYDLLPLTDEFVTLGRFESLCKNAGHSLFLLLDDHIPESWIPMQVMEKNQSNRFVVYSYSTATVDMLEQDLLQGIIFENPFNLGYNGIAAIAGYLESGSYAPQEPIDVHWLDKDNLYDKETQYIIFPY